MSLARTPKPAVLDRVVAILDAVEGGAHTFTELVHATGYTRATTHRLVKTLEDHELLVFLGGYGYRLGPRLLRLATVAMREFPLRDLARPALEWLAEVTGESAQLYIRSGDERVCIEAVESPNELRTIVPVGATFPLTAGSAGKVFMAWTDEADGERLMASAERLTPTTPTGERLGRQVDMARRRGWAASTGEREAGVGSVSAPVLGSYGELLAVVSVSGPESRMRRISAGRHAPAVVAAARDIERALGLGQSPGPSA
ncbi:MAG: IclR family transcriptional regulator [Actinomycetota bacterium]